MVILQVLAIWSIVSVPVAFIVAHFMSIAHQCEELTLQEAPCTQETRTQPKVIVFNGELTG